MAAEINIEKAKLEDLPAILALQKLAFRSEAEIYQDYTLPPLLQDENSILKEFENGTILKATSDNKIVGSVRAIQNDDTCMIGKLVVAPESRGKGIGKRLMHAIEKSFAHSEKFKISAGHKSERNLRLCEKLGYKVVGTEPITTSLCMVKMEKTLK